MSVPTQVVKLVEQFKEELQAVKSSNFKEAWVRRDYIDPFFGALGWDVDYQRRGPQLFREVIFEDTLRVEGAMKAPDYSFRTRLATKFFVEAKKPSVNLLDGRAAAFQVRRYAWTASLPLSILTDFEELAIYDCRIRPQQEDKASTARWLYMSYEEYPDRWDEIASLFSKEAVLSGSLDAFAQETKKKKGVATVDEAFLKEIEGWREMLAKDLAKRNPSLTSRELNYAVQMTIDRIVFLRICEDRGIEDYGNLEGLLNKNNIYDQLRGAFRDADDKYNSGLFHFQEEKGRDESPDDLTLNLELGDEPLKKIVKELYYPESPYQFSVMPVEILGQVYEQFLGKVISITHDHQAVVEEKPEVRKAGGVYYTPSYIVEYIVKNTVGKLLEGKTPKQVSKLKILDPACGSGSFLVGAYDYLLEWHREFYVNDGPEKNAKVLYEGLGGEWQLTSAEKKRILLNNIYGVDLDSQAVEVTKLSLLLKVLEGETNESINSQLTFFKERALPDLDNNIKWGNSLVGSDFYNVGQVGLLDEEERYRVNVFDWEEEFPQIMKKGGFDVVLGNPPYLRMETFKDLKSYLRNRYTSHDERSDLYSYFVERGHRLLQTGGRFGMIVSNKFLRAKYGTRLREFLNRHATVERIVDFAGLPVFSGATVRTVVMLTRRDPEGKVSTTYSPPLPAGEFLSVAAGTLPLEDVISDYEYQVPAETLSQSVWSFARNDSDNLLTRLKSSNVPLTEYCEGQVFMGIKSGLTQAFVIDSTTRSNIISRNPEAEEIIKPFLGGREVRRYQIDSKDKYLIYTYHGIDISKYPAVEQHLKPFRDLLEKRATHQEWYELQQPQYKFAPFMEGSKIIFPDIAKAPRFALDGVGYYGSNTTYFIPRFDLYLLGLLNSRLGEFYFVRTCAGLEGKAEIYLRFFGQYLNPFPVRTINFSDPTDIAHHNRMVELVEQMMTLHEQLSTARTANDKNFLQRQINATDKQIDRLVYELYGLTEDEIQIVEG